MVGKIDLLGDKKRREVNDEIQELDEEDKRELREIDEKLRKESYDKKKIMKEFNVTKNEKGDLECRKWRKKRNIIHNEKVTKRTLSEDEKIAKLKRNLEIYDLVDKWKQQLVELAEVTSKERRLLNDIDKMRNAMNMSHGQNDIYYQQAVKQAIKNEKEMEAKFAPEIAAFQAELDADRESKPDSAQNKAANEAFSREEEEKENEELELLRKANEEYEADLKKKGKLPGYELHMQKAVSDIRKEDEEIMKQEDDHPKTVDELERNFEEDVDIDKLKRNLEIYDLIEKWKKKSKKKERVKRDTQNQQNKILRPCRVKRKSGKDSQGEYVDDMSRYNEGKIIYKKLQREMAKYKGQGSSGAENDVIRELNDKKWKEPDYKRKKRSVQENIQRRKKIITNNNLFSIKTKLTTNETIFKEKPHIDFHDPIENGFNLQKYKNTTIYEWVSGEDDHSDETLNNKQKLDEKIIAKQQIGCDELIQTNENNKRTKNNKIEAHSASSSEEKKNLTESQHQQNESKENKIKEQCKKLIRMINDGERIKEDEPERRIYLQHEKDKASLRDLENNEYINLIKNNYIRFQNEINENFEEKRKRLRERRDISNQSNDTKFTYEQDDFNHNKFRQELDRQIDIHAQKPTKIKIRPTASSLYPLQDDFQPLREVDSKELRKLESQYEREMKEMKEKKKERADFFNAMEEAFGPTMSIDLDEFGTSTTSTIITTSQSLGFPSIKTDQSKLPSNIGGHNGEDNIESTTVNIKIERLRKYIKTKMEDTLRKFSDRYLQNVSRITLKPKNTTDFNIEEYYDYTNYNAVENIQTNITTNNENKQIESHLQEDTLERDGISVDGVFVKRYKSKPGIQINKDRTFGFGENIINVTNNDEDQTNNVLPDHRGHTEEKDGIFVQKYNRHPGQNLNKGCTFNIGENIVTETTTEVLTYSPLYNYLQFYDKYAQHMTLKEETNQTTRFAFITKDKTDSFTLPSYDLPYNHFYAYNPYEQSIHMNQPDGDRHESTLEKLLSSATLSQPKTNTNFINVQEKYYNSSDFSDLHKFRPPNMDDIKQYIDSFTRSGERFNARNFEWDPENSAYTLIDGGTTSKIETYLPQDSRGNTKTGQQFEAELLADWERKRDELKTEELNKITFEYPDPDKNTNDKQMMEEDKIDGKSQTTKRNFKITINLNDVKDEKTFRENLNIKPFLKDMFQEYKNLARNKSKHFTKADEHRKTHSTLFNNKNDLNRKILTASTSSRPHISSNLFTATTASTKKTKTSRPPPELLFLLEKTLHKYSQEILHSTKMNDMKFKSKIKKYKNMKNVIRLILENHSFHDDEDNEDNIEKYRFTDDENETIPSQQTTQFKTTDDYRINLRAQLEKVMHEYSKENDKKEDLDKRNNQLKSVVRKLLKDKSFENTDISEIDDEPVMRNKSLDFVPPQFVDNNPHRAQFETDFRIKFKTLLNVYSNEILERHVFKTRRQKRINRNMKNAFKVFIENHSTGPDDIMLTEIQKQHKISEETTQTNNNDIVVDEKTDLRYRIQKFLDNYINNGKSSKEKQENERLKELVQELLNKKCFNYYVADDDSRDRSETEPTQQTSTETEKLTTLDSELLAEIQKERQKRTKQYDYYEEDEPIEKYRNPNDPTEDYYELYKIKVTTTIATTLSQSQERKRDKYIEQAMGMHALLDEKVNEHAAKVKLLGPTTKRKTLSTPDPLASSEDENSSSEEPITYRTLGPTRKRIEMECSDSREYEIPFFGLTVTKYTSKPEERYYTPGQGFENRTTVPPSDEYNHNRINIKYELFNPKYKNSNQSRLFVPLEDLTTSTTFDYFSFYRNKMRKTPSTQSTTTQNPIVQQKHRDNYRANNLAFHKILNEQIANYSKELKQRTGTTVKRQTPTTQDPLETNEESEQDPFIYRTKHPVDPRIEVEFSDSRLYEVPFLGITLSTDKRRVRYYTPGEGFENRTTHSPSDEYNHNRIHFKYDPQIEIERQGLTFGFWSDEKEKLQQKVTTKLSSGSQQRHPQPQQQSEGNDETLQKKDQNQENPRQQQPEGNDGPLNRTDQNQNKAKNREEKPSPLRSQLNLVFNDIKRSAQASRIVRKINNIKQMFNSSITNVKKTLLESNLFKQKIPSLWCQMMSNIDQNAHRIVHAVYDGNPHNCSLH